MAVRKDQQGETKDDSKTDTGEKSKGIKINYNKAQVNHFVLPDGRNIIVLAAGFLANKSAESKLMIRIMGALRVQCAPHKFNTPGARPAGSIAPEWSFERESDGGTVARARLTRFGKRRASADAGIDIGNLQQQNAYMYKHGQIST